MQEEERVTEDEVVGWHHQLNGHDSEQTRGVADGQGGLACCSPWGRKELDTTEWLTLSFKPEISRLLGLMCQAGHHVVDFSPMVGVSVSTRRLIRICL